MKRKLSFLSALALLLALLMMPHATAVIPQDINIGGVRYFPLVMTEQPNLNQLLWSMFTTNYPVEGDSASSTLRRWMNLGTAIAYVNDHNQYYANFYAKDENYTGYETRWGIAQSIKEADEELVKGIEDITVRITTTSPYGPSTSYAAKTKHCKELQEATDPGPAMYMFGYIPNYIYYSSGLGVQRTVRYAVVLSNFRVVPVVTPEVYSGIDAETWRKSAVTIMQEPELMKHGINKSDQAVTVPCRTTVNFQETTSHTTSQSYSKSISEAVTVGLEVPIGKLLPAESKLKIESTTTYAYVWSKEMSETHSKTKDIGHEIGVELHLPPFTTEDVFSTVQETALNVHYQYPLALAYDARIVRYCTDTTGAEASKVVATFKANSNYNSKDAVSDLYARANSSSGISDPNKLSYSSSKVPQMPTLVRNVSRFIPITTSGATLGFEQSTITATVGPIKPLYDLDAIAIDPPRIYTLPIGGSLPVGDLVVRGFASDPAGVTAPYYGFKSDKGHWQLQDTEGRPITDKSIAELRVEYGELMLVANGEGAVALRYLIDEHSYPTVADPTQFITNSMVTSRPVTIKIPRGANEVNTLIAQGAATGYVGQPLDLRDCQGLASYMLDANGEKVPVRMCWEAQETEAQGIRIEPDGRTASFSKTGTFHVRATANGLTSDWVTVKAVYAGVGITLSPNRLLMGMGDTARLTPALTPAGIQDTAVYASSAPSVAIVDAQGWVTARGIGSAVITATLPSGASAQCAVRVEPDPIRPFAPGDPNAEIPEADGGGATLNVQVFNVTGALQAAFEVMDERGVGALRLPVTIEQGIATLSVKPGQLQPGPYTVYLESPGNGENRGLLRTLIGKLTLHYWPKVSGETSVSVLAGSTAPIPFPFRLEGSNPGGTTRLDVHIGGETIPVVRSGDGTISLPLPLTFPSGGADPIPVTVSAPEGDDQCAIPETRVGEVRVSGQTALLKGDLRGKLGADWLFMQAAPDVPVGISGEKADLDATWQRAVASTDAALRFAVNWPHKGAVTARLSQARTSPFNSKSAQAVPSLLSRTAPGKINSKQNVAIFEFSAQDLSRLRPGFYALSIEGGAGGRYKALPPLSLIAVELTERQDGAVDWTIPKALRVSAGQTYQLVVPIPVGHRLPALKTSSSNPKVAAIDSAGVLTAKKSGTTTVTVQRPDGSKIKCKLTVAGNSFGRAQPLYQKPRGLYTSTKRLYYGKGTLKAEVFVYNRTGAKLRGADGWTLELYDGETLIAARPLGALTFKSPLKDNACGVYKLTIGSDMLAGVSEKAFDLGGKRIQAVISGVDRNGNRAIPLNADSKGVLKLKGASIVEIG